jgi:putative inorganic carbon (HCO3(-)) transporter
MTRIKQLLGSFVNIEVFIFSGAVAASIFYEPFLPYSIVIEVLLGIASWAVQTFPIRPVPLNLPLTFLLLMLAVSLFITPLPGNTLLQVLRLLNGVLFFFCLLRSILSPQHIYGMIKALGALGLFLAISSLILVNWVEKFNFLSILIPKTLPIPKLNGSHPNVMAGAVVLFLAWICAFLAFCWSRLNRASKIGISLMAFFMFAILLLTQSRGSLIALICALAVLVLLRFRYGWILVLVSMVVVSSIIFQIGVEQIWYSIIGETGGNTFTVREEIWLRARLMIQDFPLTGIGMGNFNDVANRLYPFGLTPINMDHAHNLFLQIAVDLGLPGLIAWLACWFTILRMAWQLYRKGDGTLRALGAAVLCSQVALGTHGLLDCVTWDTRPAVIIWAIWGLTAAAWLQLRSASPAAPPLL